MTRLKISVSRMWSTITKNENGDSSSIMQMPHRLLICGPRKTGKTSISFRLAYEVASKGSTVLFVCLQNTISGNFPAHVTLVRNPVDDEDSRNGVIQESICSTWSPIILSRIKFKYVTNSSEMKKLFASIHTMIPVPHCIVVDDFTFVIDPLNSVSRQDNSFLEVSQVLGKWVILFFSEKTCRTGSSAFVSISCNILQWTSILNFN